MTYPSRQRRNVLIVGIVVVIVVVVTGVAAWVIIYDVSPERTGVSIEPEVNMTLSVGDRDWRICRKYPLEATVEFK